jgi:NADH-quinone oxidoreductase subunit M
MFNFISDYFTSSNFLLTLIFLPFFFIFPLALIPNDKYSYMRWASLIFSSITFLVSIILYISFDETLLGFQHHGVFEWMHYLNLSVELGVDGLSIFFILLTTFITPLCIISSWESIKSNSKLFIIILFLVEFLLLGVFSILNVFIFFMFFEAILIPMYLMIGIWGSRTRKIHAAYQFFLFTFFGSVFMLIGVTYLQAKFGSTSYYHISLTHFPLYVEIWLWLSFFASFAVKVPMFPFHIWLPEAHGEAPTAGSVLLAGVLLKLGTYGFLRFSMPFFPNATRIFTPLLLLLSVLAVVYGSLVTLVQKDLKKLIAYSSIAHMGIVTIGMFSRNLMGLEGSIYLMLSHGLVSSGLFLCIGVLYDRYGTRAISYYGGVVNFMPLFSTFFLIFTFANIGFPGTSAFIGEFIILMGAYSFHSLVCVFASTGVILSAAYSVWLYNRVIFGPVNSHMKKFMDLNRRETYYLGLLVFLVLLFGVLPNS